MQQWRKARKSNLDLIDFWCKVNHQCVMLHKLNVIWMEQPSEYWVQIFWVCLRAEAKADRAPFLSILQNDFVKETSPIICWSGFMWKINEPMGISQKSYIYLIFYCLSLGDPHISDKQFFLDEFLSDVACRNQKCIIPPDHSIAITDRKLWYAFLLGKTSGVVK